MGQWRPHWRSNDGKVEVTKWDETSSNEWFETKEKIQYQHKEKSNLTQPRELQ